MMIQITEDKKNEMSELCDKMLHYGGKLMQCIENMSEEGSEMMGNRRRGMGGMRTSGRGGMRDYSMGGMREPMEYGARYGNWEEEMPYDMGGMRKRYY